MKKKTKKSVNKNGGKEDQRSEHRWKSMCMTWAIRTYADYHIERNTLRLKKSEPMWSAQAACVGSQHFYALLPVFIFLRACLPSIQKGSFYYDESEGELRGKERVSRIFVSFLAFAYCAVCCAVAVVQASKQATHNVIFYSYSSTAYFSHRWLLPYMNPSQTSSQPFFCFHFFFSFISVFIEWKITTNIEPLEMCFY